MGDINKIYEDQRDVVVRFAREINKVRCLTINKCKSIKSNWGKKMVILFVKRINRENKMEVIRLVYKKGKNFQPSKCLELNEDFTILVNVNDILIKEKQESENLQEN